MKVIKSIAFLLAILAFRAVISSYQPTTVVSNRSQQQQQQTQLQQTREADELAIRELVVNYVTALQSYDYRILNRLNGLQYCTPDYRELVEKHAPLIISQIKRDKESHQVESVQVNFIEMASPRTAYVTYNIKGNGTSNGENPVPVDIRGDIICQKIDEKWLVDLNDLEPRKERKD